MQVSKDEKLRMLWFKSFEKMYPIDCVELGVNERLPGEDDQPLTTRENSPGS